MDSRTNMNTGSGGTQGCQNGSSPTDRPTSPIKKTWIGSEKSAHQPETTRPIKSVNSSGQPAGQNRPARSPYALIKKHVQRCVFNFGALLSLPDFPFPSIFLSLSLVTIPIPFLLHPRRWPRTRTKTVQPIHHFASLFHRDLHHFASLLHRDIQHVAGQEHEGSAAARERSAGRTQSHHRTPIRGRFRRPRPPRRQVFAFQFPFFRFVT